VARTFLNWLLTLTYDLDFQSSGAVVLTHTHATKPQPNVRSVVSKDEVETNGRTDTTDRVIF